jgi:hypothetical protein
MFGIRRSLPRAFLPFASDQADGNEQQGKHPSSDEGERRATRQGCRRIDHFCGRPGFLHLSPGFVQVITPLGIGRKKPSDNVSRRIFHSPPDGVFLTAVNRCTAKGYSGRVSGLSARRRTIVLYDLFTPPLKMELSRAPDVSVAKDHKSVTNRSRPLDRRVHVSPPSTNPISAASAI